MTNILDRLLHICFSEFKHWREKNKKGILLALNDIGDEMSKEREQAKNVGDSGLLAVVMGTHNHPSIVEEILELSAQDYYDLGIDVYYFDSSSNDETQKIIEKYNEKGYENIVYVPVPGMNLHEKLDLMFQGKGLKKHYKYIWPSKDRCSFKRSALERIVGKLEDDYDAVFVLTSKEGETEYHSAAEFYHDWGTWVTSVNTTIYNTEKLMKNLPFSDLVLGEDDYLFHFKHYYYFFYKLAQKNDVRIVALDCENQINMLPDKKVNDLLFVRVWKDRWVEVNEALPDLYNPYKDYVIKKTAELPWMLGSRDKLLELHRDGVLTEENLPIFFEKWEELSNIPKTVLIDIAKGVYDIKFDLSQIKGCNQLLDYLCDFSYLLRTGFMDTTKFPYEIAKTSINTLVSLLVNGSDYSDFVKETIESIWSEIEMRDMNNKELADHLQQIITLLV